jgi:hypothetical protein
MKTNKRAEKRVNYEQKWVWVLNNTRFSFLDLCFKDIRNPSDMHSIQVLLAIHELQCLMVHVLDGLSLD